MRHILFILFCIPVILLNGCGEDVVAPNGGGDDKSFRIVAVSKDSVYLAEDVIVTLRNAEVGNAESDSFKVFLHTVPVTLDSVWHDTTGNTFLRVTVPEGATTSRIRIFQHDSVLAKGDFTLVIFQLLYNWLDPVVYDFTPHDARPEDTITIIGSSLPMRRSEIQVTVGGVPLPVVGWDDKRILATIPPGLQGDSVIVQVFDIEKRLGKLRISDPSSERFLNEGTLRYAGIGVTQVQWFDTTLSISFTTPDTIFHVRKAEEIYQLWLNYTPFSQMPSSEDSVVFVTDDQQSGRRLKLELRMKREAGARLSGVIRASLDEEKSSGNNVLTWEVILKNARWLKLADGTYRIFGYAFENPEVIQKMRTSSDDKSPNGMVSQTKTYDPFRPATSFQIDLRP